MRYFENAGEAWWRGWVDAGAVHTEWSGGSQAEAVARPEAHLERLIRRKRADGFVELPVAPGTFIGQIRWNEAKLGPGWIRLQDGRDTHFATEAVDGLTEAKIGTRVVVRELSPYVGPDAATLHQGKLEAGAVLPFPKPLGKRVKVKSPAPRAGLGAELAAAKKASSSGPPPALGALAFTYEKGVHRVIATGATVWYEPVFTLAGKRRRGPANSCGAGDCAALPDALAKELEALLEAELAQVPAS